jgi:aryl-alcohol dehydrogenase
VRAKLLRVEFSSTREAESPSTPDRQRTVHNHFFGQSSVGTFTLAYERDAIKVTNDVLLELLGPLGCGVGLKREGRRP